MKKRYVSIDQKVYPTIDFYVTKCTSVLTKSKPETHRFKEAEKFLEELNHLNHIINELYSLNGYAPSDACVCQLDESAKFYHVRLVTPQELRKHIAQKKISVCHNFDETNSINKRGFDVGKYVNTFEFVETKKTDCEYIFKLFESQLYKRRVFERKYFQPNEFEEIKEEIFNKTLSGKHAIFEIAIRKTFF